MERTAESIITDINLKNIPMLQTWAVRASLWPHPAFSGSIKCRFDIYIWDFFHRTDFALCPRSRKVIRLSELGRYGNIQNPNLQEAAAKEALNLFGSIICISGLTGAHVGEAVAHVRAPLPRALRGHHRHHLRGLLLDRHPWSVARLGMHPRSVARLGMHPWSVGRLGGVLLLISHAWKREKSKTCTSDLLLKPTKSGLKWHQHSSPVW